ncbi:MAG: tetratricopeptide repeat protein, partial [Planctomycetes bacterium]|nr:tetratricopeptide repeat protein [Planctomycetota bacterium]
QMSIDACERALKIQPDHWGAQFMKGMNLSQWPDFLGKQPEAIRTFETLIEQQEKSTATEGEDFAETYFQLGTLYRKSGNTDKALDAFKRGLAAFPEDKKIREQIELLEKR